MQHLVTYLVIIALALPLVVYVWAAMGTKHEKVSTLANYFIAYRQVGAGPFANSSLAYNFQVATLFPFMYWGIQGQVLPAIVNSIFLGLGIVLFRRCLPAILRSLDGSTHQPRTLHGLLGDAFSSRAVQQIAAWVTISGMIGVALAEAYWGMQVLRVLVLEDTVAFYTLVFGALMFVMTYVWYGGTWGSMRTDQLQLVFSYLGFTGVFVFAIASFLYAGPSTARPESGLVSALMLAMGALAVGVRLRYKVMPISAMSANDADSIIAHDPDDRGWDRLSMWLSRAILLACVLLAVCFGVIFIRSFGTISLSPLKNPGDPGWIGVMALIVMPLCFQFVDMSAWQRMQAIGGTQQGISDRARRGLLVFAVESPFSWIMCLALGTLVITVMPQLADAPDRAGPLAAFPRLLIESGSFLHIAVALSFMGSWSF